MQSSPTRCAKARPGVVNDSVTARITSPVEASRQLLNLFMAIPFKFHNPRGSVCLQCLSGTFVPLTVKAQTVPDKHNFPDQLINPLQTARGKPLESAKLCVRLSRTRQAIKDQDDKSHASRSDATAR